MAPQHVCVNGRRALGSAGMPEAARTPVRRRLPGVARNQRSAGYRPGRWPRLSRGRCEDAGARTRLHAIESKISGLLTQRDQLKFVICSREDYDWSKAFLQEHGLAARLPDTILAKLQRNNPDPVGGLEFWRTGCKCVFQLQLHKVLWGRHSGQVTAASSTAQPKRAVVLLSGGLDSAHRVRSGPCTRFSSATP